MISFRKSWIAKNCEFSIITVKILLRKNTRSRQIFISRKNWEIRNSWTVIVENEIMIWNYSYCTVKLKWSKNGKLRHISLWWIIYCTNKNCCISVVFKFQLVRKEFFVNQSIWWKHMFKEQRPRSTWNELIFGQHETINNYSLIPRRLFIVWNKESVAYSDRLRLISKPKTKFKRDKELDEQKMKAHLFTISFIVTKWITKWEIKWLIVDQRSLNFYTSRISLTKSKDRFFRYNRFL